MNHNTISAIPFWSGSICPFFATVRDTEHYQDWNEIIGRGFMVRGMFRRLQMLQNPGGGLTAAASQLPRHHHYAADPLRAAPMVTINAIKDNLGNDPKVCFPPSSLKDTVLLPNLAGGLTVKLSSTK